MSGGRSDFQATFGLGNTFLTALQHQRTGRIVENFAGRFKAEANDFHLQYSSPISVPCFVPPTLLSITLFRPGLNHSLLHAGVDAHHGVREVWCSTTGLALLAREDNRSAAVCRPLLALVLDPDIAIDQVLPGLDSLRRHHASAAAEITHHVKAAYLDLQRL